MNPCKVTRLVLSMTVAVIRPVRDDQTRLPIFGALNREVLHERLEGAEQFTSGPLIDDKMPGH